MVSAALSRGAELNVCEILLLKCLNEMLFYFIKVIIFIEPLYEYMS